MIEIAGLSRAFGARRVLDEIRLAIGAGERVALVGANGAGKTTLIRCLLGEYRYEGELRIDGLSPRSARTALLRHVGFVPQLPPPLRMPVGELLRFAAEVCGCQRERMEEVARRLALDPVAVRRQPFARLSGGQKQKLLIAVALGRDARLLLMDEPAANLDPAARGVFFELLAERAGRATMLLSSHRLDEVASLVSRVVELDHGRVVLDDHVAEGPGAGHRLACRIVMRRSEPAFTRALERWGVRGDDAGLTFEGHVASPDRLRFLALLSRWGGQVRSIHLEDDSPSSGASSTS